MSKMGSATDWPARCATASSRASGSSTSVEKTICVGPAWGSKWIGRPARSSARLRSTSARSRGSRLTSGSLEVSAKAFFITIATYVFATGLSRCGRSRRTATSWTNNPRSAACKWREAEREIHKMGAPLWRSYDEQALNEQLNLRARTPEHPEIFARWEAESHAARRRLPHRFDAAYGPSPGERLDFFPAADKNAPLLAFIHGGYWQGLDKGHFSYFAPAFIEKGIAFASINYSLAPQARIGTMVEQVRRALAWLYRGADELGFDRERIVVAGHSAGGHLAAMASLTDWAALDLPRNLIAGCCSVSGVYQLQPIRQSYHQPVLQLSEDEVMRLSPQGLPPPQDIPAILAVGALEPEEFRVQQGELAAVWGLDNAVKALEVPGRHHFDVVDALLEDDQPLRETLLLLLQERSLP